MHITTIVLDGSNFWPFNWYYISAFLIGVTSLFIAWRNFKKKSEDKPKGIPIKQNTSQTQSQTTHVNVYPPAAPTHSEMESPSNGGSDGFEKYKKLTNILFIDDDNKFKVVKILINNGWINTQNITDIESYDEPILLKSQIVFVDVQGVGQKLDCKDEGLSLACNIKKKHPEKKVIIYSAVPTHNIFHDAIKIVDFMLSKDAEPYEFISLIEEYSKEVIK